jgi:hypothetical protein
VVVNFLCYLPNNRRSLGLGDPKPPKKHQHRMQIQPPTVKYKQGAKRGIIIIFTTRSTHAYKCAMYTIDVRRGFHHNSARQHQVQYIRFGRFSHFSGFTFI